MLVALRIPPRNEVRAWLPTVYMFVMEYRWLNTFLIIENGLHALWKRTLQCHVVQWELNAQNTIHRCFGGVLHLLVKPCGWPVTLVCYCVRAGDSVHHVLDISSRISTGIFYNYRISEPSLLHQKRCSINLWLLDSFTGQFNHGSKPCLQKLR